MPDSPSSVLMFPAVNWFNPPTPSTSVAPLATVALGVVNKFGRLPVVEASRNPALMAVPPE